MIWVKEELHSARGNQYFIHNITVLLQYRLHTLARTPSPQPARSTVQETISRRSSQQAISLTKHMTGPERIYRTIVRGHKSPAWIAGWIVAVVYKRGHLRRTIACVQWERRAIVVPHHKVSVNSCCISVAGIQHLALVFAKQVSPCHQNELYWPAYRCNRCVCLSVAEVFGQSVKLVVLRRDIVLAIETGVSAPPVNRGWVIRGLIAVLAAYFVGVWNALGNHGGKWKNCDGTAGRA